MGLPNAPKMSPPQVANSLAFYLSPNSVRNTVITGSDVSYEIATPKEIFHSGDRVTTITRVERNGEKRVVGEYIWPALKKSRVRVLLADGDALGEWVPTNDFLLKRGGILLSTSRIFSGANGVQYKWSIKGFVGQHLTLTYDSDESAQGPYALAVFHLPRRNIGLQEVREAYLEVSPTVQSDLDVIIVTFLLVERERRDRERGANAAA